MWERTTTTITHDPGTDPDGKAVLQQDLPVSAHGTVSTDLTLAADAALGYYNISLAGIDSGSGSFYVEEY